MTVSFTIPGKPYAKRRPRFSRKIGRAFNPSENIRNDESVAAIAARHFPAPIEGPVGLEVICTFALPASWSKKRRAEHIHRPHCQKPDADNVVKAIADGLNRIAWADDKQVADMRVSKVWGLQDQTVVHVTAKV